MRRYFSASVGSFPALTAFCLLALEVTLFGQAVFAQEEPGLPCGSELIRAIDIHDRTKIHSLLKSNVNLNERSCPEGKIALSESIAEGMSDVAKELILRGADANLTEQKGASPLMIAAFYCNEEVVVMLLSRGAHVDSADSAGYTALMQAADTCDDGRIITILLHAGANPNLRTRDGNTALTVAAFYGNEAAVNELVAAGADINTETAEHETAFSIARDRVVGRKPSHDRIFSLLNLLREAMPQDQRNF